jgi:5-methyltetrahydropteroyltriglutamate--homocysteine methyltransferase
MGNEHYATQDELLWALADALKDEYERIIDAGFQLQVDDAWIPALWDHDPGLDLETYRRFCQTRIEALNHALKGLPTERVRYHLCWGSWHGPHATDIEFREIVDLMLQVDAGIYSIEAANVRHEHEYHVWEDVKLPDGKLLIPGVITHASNIVEHPELIAERIGRFAQAVGRENVIAGADCGFASFASTCEVHPSVVWVKLKALAEGAARQRRVVAASGVARRSPSHMRPF